MSTPMKPTSGAPSSSASGGLSASDAGAIAAAVIAGVALLVSMGHILYERHIRRQDALKATADRERDAAAQADERKRTLLDAFTKKYVGVQSGLALLGNVKQRNPDGLLWAKLTGQPPAGQQPAANASQLTPLQAQQLEDGQLALLGQVSKACFEAKDWWTRFYAAVREDELPPLFGKTAPGAAVAVDLIDHRKRRAEGGTGGELWRKRSNNFRTLVEPYDIANYYNAGLHRTPNDGVVHYTANRPGIFKDLQAIEITAQQRVALATAAQRPPKVTTYQSSLVWAEKAEEAFDADTARTGAPQLAADVAPLSEQALPPVSSAV